MNAIDITDHKVTAPDAVLKLYRDQDIFIINLLAQKHDNK